MLQFFNKNDEILFIKNIISFNKDIDNISPYDYCKELKLYDICRLMFIKNPEVIPYELARLNYDARRMGMFLFYAAVFDNKNDFNIFKKLRRCTGGKSIIQNLIKYL